MKILLTALITFVLACSCATTGGVKKPSVSKMPRCTDVVAHLFKKAGPNETILPPVVLPGAQGYIFALDMHHNRQAKAVCLVKPKLGLEIEYMCVKEHDLNRKCSTSNGQYMLYGSGIGKMGE
jgi:hypothetical protein